MSFASITLEGVRQHNLQNLSIELPRDQFIVVTGPSGSGKSSLAFDVLFAEGQRRYIDTLSPYARQFIQQVERADFDHIEGIPPAIAIEQRTTQGSAKTTVATLTEIWHYLRLLFARVGKQFCHGCGKRLEQGSPRKIEQEILQRFAGRAVILLAPIVRGRKGHYRELLRKYQRAGFKQARIDGKVVSLKSGLELSRYQEHDIDLCVPGYDSAAIKTALELGKGVVRVLHDQEETTFNVEMFCPDCGIGYAEIEPRAFSFNCKRGWCKVCEGYGFTEVFDAELLIGDAALALDAGVFPVFQNEPFHKRASETFARQVREALHINTSLPWKKLSIKNKQSILFGNKDFEGLIPKLEAFKKRGKGLTNLAQFIAQTTCSACKGARLRPESLSVLLQNQSIGEIAQMSVTRALQWLQFLRLPARDASIAKEILKELIPKLQFLEEVGLGYLSLDRRGDTLSGGESQRIRLAASLGSQLTGVLYVLDEPTIGLHARDQGILLGALKKLRDRGNSVVVVEHDEETIRGADLLIDLGPGAGVNGGKLVFQGSPKQIVKQKDSKTGQALRGEGRKRWNPRSANQFHQWITVHGVAENNLKNITVRLPAGALTVVSGVSGSGKSSLVREVLYKALKRQIDHSPIKPGNFTKLEGGECFSRVSEVDQTPIGRTPRSVPASYIGFWDSIRQLFAATAEARARGYTASRFSFNVQGGRCEACRGQGQVKLAMNFLPAAHIPCEVCRGARFNQETLEITYRGKNIAEVLRMTATEAVDFFSAHPGIKRRLEMLENVGLGYLILGQESPTLSGGEAQRIKLVEELGKWSKGKTFYLLDEPTTGLALSDIVRLIKLLHMLVERGDTVVVIEHQLDIIKEADWLIDLGPQGGEHGGRVVAEGFPLELVKQVNKYPQSHTLAFLAQWFARWGTLLSK